MDKIVYYCDKFIVSEQETGFVINFLKDQDDNEATIDYSFRIGMSPLSAKELMLILFTAIGEFEEKYGMIKIQQDVAQKLIKSKTSPIGFQTPELPDDEKDVKRFSTHYTGPDRRKKK